jgi:hypothetical protein
MVSDKTSVDEQSIQKCLIEILAETIALFPHFIQHTYLRTLYDIFDF